MPPHDDFAAKLHEWWIRQHYDWWREPDEPHPYAIDESDDIPY